MKIEKSTVVKLYLTDLDALDPVTVYLEDYTTGKGKIVIECYGESWCSYWGGMGERNIAGFFCSCDEHYLAKNLAPNVESEIFDIDKIQEDAEEKGLYCDRDDPWDDYAFMSEMYGGDCYEWFYQLPKITNPKYKYVCRIINTVKNALKEQNKGGV